MSRLVSKVALISGAGTGIGRAIALRFAREGAHIGLLGRRREPLEAVAAEIAALGGKGLAISGDASRSADASRAVRATAEHFGKLNVLVNNAGAVHAGTVEKTTEEEFERLMDANVRTTFLLSRAALPELRKGGGSIVNVGSYLGLVGIQNRAVYCAAKGAVTMLTRAMALDHAAENIRVNCICPHATETEMFAGAMAQYADPEAQRRARIATIPLGRIGQPDDIAQLAVYLASEESSWMTGATIPLDGGVTAA